MLAFFKKLVQTEKRGDELNGNPTPLVGAWCIVGNSVGSPTGAQR